VKGEVLVPIARKLRDSQTDAEQRLWSHLRRQQCDGFRFRRQVPLGSYVTDFACLSESLIVEVDGGQHSENAVKDAERTKWLESEGYRILRFWNHDVLQNTDGVIETIERTLRGHPVE